MKNRPENPFCDIKKNHSEAIKVRLSRVAFTGSTLRMFKKGSAKSIRRFVQVHIGIAPWLKDVRSSRKFDARFYALVRRFPRGVRVGKKGARPRFGHKAKIVSLYFKALLTERKPIDARTAARVEKWFHVPLDNIVLNKVYSHFETEIDIDRKLTLSSLGKSQYRNIQELLRDKAKGADVPPIWYDDLWALRDEDNR